jgi:hypothetical protein
MTERERQRQRERVLVIFEEHRETPGAAFDEGHFLDFLLAAPEKKRAVYESAAGMKRLDAFLDRIQLEYSICFSHAERGANYPLDAFVAKVMALVEAPRTSMVSFQGLGKPMFDWPVAGVGNIVVLLLVLAQLDRPWLVAILVALGLALNGLWLFSRRRYAQYRQQLHRQLLQAIDAHRKLATKQRIDSLG